MSQGKHITPARSRGGSPSDTAALLRRRLDLKWPDELSALRAWNEATAALADPRREALIAEVVEEYAAEQGFSRDVALVRRDPQRLNTNQEGHVLEVSDSLRRNATRCPDPKRLLYEDGARHEHYLVVRCMRRTCPACRPLIIEQDTDRILSAFDGRPMYATTVVADDWQAFRTRALRAGVEYVGVPAMAEARRVFSTAPLDGDTRGTAEDVREAMVERPIDRRRIRGSAGFLEPKAKPSEEEALTPVGVWSGNKTAADLEAMAAKIGLPAETVEPTVAAQGLRVLVGRHDPRAELFRNAVGVLHFDDEEDYAPELAEAWDRDPFLHHQAAADVLGLAVPDEVYDRLAEQLVLIEEAA